MVRKTSQSCPNEALAKSAVEGAKEIEYSGPKYFSTQLRTPCISNRLELAEYTEGTERPEECRRTIAAELEKNLTPIRKLAKHQSQTKL